ncbi:MAG: hypothetical protein J5I93_02385 [Pirellulaceae bacterium]|nr:hypothetical protein [Pirellulaceae bacterium]
MNKPLGQALQILILGFALLLAIAIWFKLATGLESPEPVSGTPSVTGPPPATHWMDSLPILICMFGAVGGVANNFRRFQRLRYQNWKDLNSTVRWLMTLQLYLSPLIGALFAMVLYGAFASEILQGSLFPKFNSEAPYLNLSSFADSMRPATNGDVAKALFWAFMAGFAEGLVPNIIDKVGKQAEAGATQPGTGETTSQV